MRKIIVFISVLLFIISSPTFAANRYWISSISGNWNTSANWSATSGGPGSAGVPTASDDVFFDGAGGAIGNCIINSNANTRNITVFAAYTGTISQNAGNTITINGSSIWSGGVFTGGNSTITNKGSFTLSGSNFTNTSGTLNIKNTMTFTSGIFAHNLGTTLFSYDGTNLNYSINGTPTFYNLKFQGDWSTLTVTANNAFIVTNNLILDGNASIGNINLNVVSGNTITVNGALQIIGGQTVRINTGTIDVAGDITDSNTNSFGGGTGTIHINGIGDQTLTGAGIIGQGLLPNIIIDKTSGTLTLANTITVAGPMWSYLRGGLNPGTSTVSFYRNTTGDFTVSGPHTLNNVVTNTYYNTTHISNDLTVNNLTIDGSTNNTMNIASQVTVNGNLTLSGTDQIRINTGILNVNGDINLTNTNNSPFAGGSGTLNIIGPGNQSLFGTTVQSRCFLPKVIINKVSGTLTMFNYINLAKDWVYVQGAVDATSNNSTVVLSNDGTTILTIDGQGISNTMAFDNMTIIMAFGNDVYLGGNLDLDGNLTVSASRNFKVTNSNYNINVAGDWIMNGVFFPSSGTVTFDGAISQQITTGSNNFYNVVVNNTAASLGFNDLVLNDILPVTNSATFTTGVMLTTANKYLYLKDAASSNLGTNNSYVNGPLRYDMAVNGARILNFPIGKSADWRPVKLVASNNSATSYTYKAEVTNADAQALGYATPATINVISRVHFWDIERTLTSTGVPSPTTNVSGTQTITLYYGTNDYVTDPTNLTIVKNTNTATTSWFDIGGNGASVGAGSITSTSAPTAFTSYSRFTLANKIGGTNPLPIELESFSCNFVDENTTMLLWTTASESNNDYFAIERSIDGVYFETIGMQKGAGNSAAKHEYTFKDEHPKNGISYYRLNQIDFGGKFTYSEICSTVNNSNELSLYPNPVKNILTLDYNLYEPVKYNSVVVKDVLGKEFNITSSYKDSKIIFDCSNLGDGIYFLNVLIGNKEVKNKFIVQK